MCFAHDARPPLPPADLLQRPISGGAAAELLELTSADGTRFSAALAQAADGASAGVVILPDVRGLYPFYIELAERFAEAGHHAVAIDPYGRSAGLGPRGEDFEWGAHVQALRIPQVQADVAAAAALLRERAELPAVVTVGFCLGGSLSFLVATHEGVDGAVGFYAGLEARTGFAGPLERAAEIRVPVLGLFGQADERIPVEQVNEFAARLTESAVPHEIQVYPGAPHSFFDRRQDEYAEASADAWRRTLGFIERLPGRREPAPS